MNMPINIPDPANIPEGLDENGNSKGAGSQKPNPFFGENPPVQQPPVQEPPVQQPEPQVDETIVEIEEPITNEPPVQQPEPVQEPPVQEPPVQQPPMEEIVKAAVAETVNEALKPVLDQNRKDKELREIHTQAQALEKESKRLEALRDEQMEGSATYQYFQDEMNKKESEFDTLVQRQQKILNGEFDDPSQTQNQTPVNNNVPVDEVKANANWDAFIRDHGSWYEKPGFEQLTKDVRDYAIGKIASGETSPDRDDFVPMLEQFASRMNGGTLPNQKKIGNTVHTVAPNVPGTQTQLPPVQGGAPVTRKQRVVIPQRTRELLIQKYAVGGNK